jgi:hypothetical protein
MIGGSNPAMRHRSSILPRNEALAMCLQFQVSKKDRGDRGDGTEGTEAVIPPRSRKLLRAEREHRYVGVPERPAEREHRYVGVPERP